MHSIANGRLLALRRVVIGGREESKQPVRLVSYAGGEIQPVTRSGGMIITELQRPQPVVLERMPIGIAHEPIEAAAGEIVNSDLTAAGIADEEVVAIEAKVRRRQRNAPRRIQPRSAFQPLEEFAGRRELVNKSETRKVEIIMFGCVLPGIRDIQVAIYGLYIKRSKTFGNLAINKHWVAVDIRKLNGIEVSVINFDAAGADVRHIHIRGATNG